MFGDVIVAAHNGSVVENPSLSRVTIGRAAEAPVRSYVPIGTRTRRSACCGWTVSSGTQAGEGRPDPPPLSRSGTPRSPDASRLVRGTSLDVEKELGSFVRPTGGLTAVVWAAVVNFTALRAEPVEAAAAAFGTGAQCFLAALMNRVGQALPG